MVVSYTTEVSDDQKELIFSWEAEGVATLELRVALTNEDGDALDVFMQNLLTARTVAAMNGSLDEFISEVEGKS